MIHRVYGIAPTISKPYAWDAPGDLENSPLFTVEDLAIQCGMEESDTFTVPRLQPSIRSLGSTWVLFTSPKSCMLPTYQFGLQPERVRMMYK